MLFSNDFKIYIASSDLALSFATRCTLLTTAIFILPIFNKHTSWLFSLSDRVKCKESNVYSRLGGIIDLEYAAEVC